MIEPLFEPAFDHAHNVAGDRVFCNCPPPVGPVVPVTRTGAGDPNPYGVREDLSAICSGNGPFEHSLF